MAETKSKNSAQAEALRGECFRRWLQGQTQNAIARQLGLTQSAICYHLKLARQEAARERDEILDLALARLEKVILEATSAWERSKRPAGTMTDTTIVDAHGGATRRTVRRSHPCGDPAYLAIILKCIEQERHLLGLDMPAKVALTTRDGRTEWTGGLSGLLMLQKELAN